MYNNIIERIDNGNFDIRVNLAIKQIINEEVKAYISTANSTEHINLSATSMMLFERLISSVFQNLVQQITSLVSNAESQENELLNLDAHLGNADDKTMAMKLFEALKDIEKEKAIADEAYARQLIHIENLKQQRLALIAKRISLIKAIAEKENSNDDDVRTVKYAAISMEVLTEFKVRLQSEKLSKLSDTVTSCFKKLVEKNSLVSKVVIDSKTLDITLLDAEGKELLKVNFLLVSSRCLQFQSCGRLL